MSNSTAISINLANTAAGAYDVRLPVPKPLQCDPHTGRITRPVPGNDIDQIIGFAVDPDEFEVDLGWSEWAGFDPMDPDDIIGLFPVVTERDGGMATLTLPVRQVSVNGRVLGAQAVAR